ncbi:hypothetical protein P3X46_010745 [Hevea brasiliensis]|uniref:Protein kinase domain-containing protein n=1 Tax=Hevea brasiliensis TaxID=3981 RepID=A0ABQ9MJ41_HEVBR|nr:wall-associated receptor kinase-like 8 [Hevea brasiliensis]XP_021691181.2 wall-associated receptor kinase-like 8 [Hevea brasiliensis]XP_058004691.1 wall-associated receptor kinase-like 8 [Hevea brasiliensis]KAJ9129318.1 hypothetical protein P3X46_033886 [Hevea brasiliensis]KAJ9178899.1 hypothetical protein P3X46_010745 [Hevea brasiliensis]
MARPLINFTFVLLLTIRLAIATAPMAKPNCADRCGNISIPYPFGMGKDCYMDEWFEVECNTTSYPPTAILSRIQTELLGIDFQGGTARVRSPIITSNCHSRDEGLPVNSIGSFLPANLTVSSLPVNLTGSYFFLSDANLMIAIGCNTRALLTPNTPHLVGCDSTCHAQNDVDWQEMIPKFMTTYSDVHWIQKYCSGYNCCQATIPSFLQFFNASLQAIDGNQSNDSCKLTFLADGSAWVSKEEKHSPLQAGMQLTWRINSKIWKYDDFETANCNKSYISFYETGFLCSCKNGYEGNPYLGCTDIDECNDPTYSSCQWTTKCVNTPGSYKCVVNMTSTIIFGVFGGVLVLLVVALGTRWLHKSIKKRKNIRQREKFFKRMLQQQTCSGQGNVDNAKIFSLKELEKATDHFNVNRILGQGGQGIVYKGMLVDGRIVAVKKSRIANEAELEQFINEVVILSQINHRNVVKLLGCCLETEVPLLVYEFISNGTLHRYLNDPNEEFQLSWEMRLQIAIEISGALSYLHSAAAVPIFHRDIKSKNILLDEKYGAKVSDFGISRSIALGQTHLTTNVQGTFGYLDPQYFQTSKFTEKSDVYSFGVVLVELLTGQEPIYSAMSQEIVGLASHFIHMMENDKLLEMLDPRIMEHCVKEEVMVVANLAKRCLNFQGKKRPTMKQVTMELEAIWFCQQDLDAAQIHWEETKFAEAASSTWSSFGTIGNSSIDTQPSVSNSW